MRIHSEKRPFECPRVV